MLSRLHIDFYIVEIFSTAVNSITAVRTIVCFKRPPGSRYNNINSSSITPRLQADDLMLSGALVELDYGTKRHSINQNENEKEAEEDFQRETCHLRVPEEIEDANIISQRSHALVHSHL